MKKIVYISKDDNNAIVLCKDGYQGVAIQVVRLMDQLKPTGPNNELTNFKSNQVISNILVPIEDKSAFKENVAKAILDAKEFLANIKTQDDEIDGLMNDYHSQHEGLNKHE